MTQPLHLCSSFAFWGESHYIRNLVAAEEGVFELMARGAAAVPLRALRSTPLS